MNIFLIPYTWMRHVQVALWCGIFSTTAWWLYVMFFLYIGPFWGESYDGFIWLAGLVVAVSGGSLLLEGNMRRTSLRKRILKIVIASGVAFGSFFVLFLLYQAVLGSVFFSLLNLLKTEDITVDLADMHRTAFQNQLFLFLAAGVSVSLGTLSVRGWRHSWFHFGNHLLGGVIAGLSFALVWTYFLYFYSSGLDLYYSGAFGSLTFGFFFGLSAWSVPDELYAGWLRVMSSSRFGHRVPIDATAEETKERFVGSYANGLDLYLPLQEGVMELHVSAFVESGQKYILRGLSQQATQIKRPLESVNLQYEPQSPQPAETQLYSEDLIYMGKSGVIEFIMLPREEK